MRTLYFVSRPCRPRFPLSSSPAAFLSILGNNQLIDLLHPLPDAVEQVTRDLDDLEGIHHHDRLEERLLGYGLEASEPTESRRVVNQQPLLFGQDRGVRGTPQDTQKRGRLSDSEMVDHERFVRYEAPSGRFLLSNTKSPFSTGVLPSTGMRPSDVRSNFGALRKSCATVGAAAATDKSSRVPSVILSP